MASCLRTMILYMVERKYANGRKHTTQAHNSSTNGGDASRVGKRCGYLLEFIYSSFLYPDARRVAPISA